MAEEALESSIPKANFIRLTRLLIRGGENFLRETLDSFYSPDDLHLKLTDSGTDKNLNLSPPERACLYPSPGKTGESKDFDITLTFKLLKKICSLTEPPSGWNKLPSDSEETLEADLARINHYRNEVYAHHRTMEIPDEKFVDLWKRIKEALLRIATKVCPEKRDEWEKSIDNLLGKSLTPDEERCIEELKTWYMQDEVLKTEVVNLREEIKDIKSSIMVIKMHICGRDQATGSEPSLPEPEQAVGADDPEPNNPPDIDAWTVILSFKESAGLFLQYLMGNLRLVLRNKVVKSWHITVECSSLQVLEGLWEDYRSGHLNSVAQEMLITQQVLEKLGLTELKLKTFISKDQYERGKKLLEASSGAVDESDIQSAIQATITKPISEGSIEPDLLARISTLERENVELKEIVKAIEGKFQSDRASSERISKIEQENIELRRLIETNQESRRLKEKNDDERILSLQMRSLDTETSFSQNLSKLNEELRMLPKSRRPRFMEHDRRESEGLEPVPFPGKKGFCQIIIDRTTQEELVDKKNEIAGVFQGFNYYVDKVTCTPSYDLKTLVEGIAARDYVGVNIFVCFILSNLTENMEIESLEGGAFNLQDLMGMFNPMNCPQLSGRPKVFIFLVHQKAGASESKYSVPKTLTAHLPFHGLCLFVPYSQGYLSALLTQIELRGSDLDLLTILEEAKKSFYKKTSITIPDPVHNFTERVFLVQAI